MSLKLIKIAPKKALNKAFLKLRPLRSEIDLFKENLITLLGKVNEAEREENQKNHIRDFLRDTYYKGTNEINTKGTQDLVIHVDKTDQSNVGVIIEAKRPSNKADWISPDKPNAKALHELVLYYMRERVDSKNIDIKYIVATNIYEWYIIDASYFDRIFYGNKQFVKDYEEWRDGTKVRKDTNLFYNDIAKPFIDKLNEEIQATYFNIKEYEEILTNESKDDDRDLIALLKLLSPNHLLRVPFANDSNELNSRFYKELLHIIGLEEVKEGGKQIIKRKTKDASEGSMIENTINILKTEDVLIRLKNKQIFGDNKEEQLYNLALELNLTWINRVLFLKLLEGQLLSYHKKDKRYNFLNKDVVFDYDEIYKLFHQVLAKTKQERTGSIVQKYQWVPYLNSSLFEISELENQTIKINSLDDHAKLDILNGSILSYSKNTNLNPLQYLFEFLDAYDFASEGVEEVQEDNRTLINASILGKIFEKINGYKDGSIYTPGFITMYMCRQAIRRAVVQKFKDAYGWNINEFGDIRNYIADRKSKADLLEFNAVINALRVCDPAVGSGHFLVSGLNELILIKYELGILCDSEGSRISDYDLTIENDELIVSYANGGDIFEYQIINGKPKSKEDQRLQKTLFHEKQTIIENCLFGVDINPNSVKICRLRLWIELLKNAYYKEESEYTELETLPNIDINIKCGNSLVSRFALDADLSIALKSIKYDIKTYRGFVQDYKNCKDREAKRGIEDIINAIKNDFRSEIGKKDKDVLKLNALNGELFNLLNQKSMFETDKEKKDKEIRVKKLEADINTLSAKIDDIKSNAIYRDAFEWRFEFPEVLDDDGNFVGFDVVVGNPPYIISRESFNKELKTYFSNKYHLIHEKPNLYLLFVELSFNIMKENGEFGFIIPNSITGVESAYKVRSMLINNYRIQIIINLLGETFINVGVETCILMASKNSPSNKIKYLNLETSDIKENEYNEVDVEIWRANRNYLFDIKSTVIETAIIDKIKRNSDLLSKLYVVKVGLQAYETGKGTPKQTISDVQNHIYDYNFKYDDFTLPYLNGSDIGRYKINWAGQYLRYGNWLSQPKTIEQFTGPRILIREITGKFPNVLQSMYVEGTFLNNKSILNIQANENSLFTLKFLVAYLNSKLVSFYHIRQTVKGNRNLFPKIVVKDLQNYPVPFLNQTIMDLIEEKSVSILKLKNHDQDTTELESEIDQLVYELYGLTEEEIKVVEGK